MCNKSSTHIDIRKKKKGIKKVKGNIAYTMIVAHYLQLIQISDIVEAISEFVKIVVSQLKICDKSSAHMNTQKIKLSK